MKKYKNILRYSNYTYTLNDSGKEKTVWTKAIQQAINENDDIYFPEGKYFVDDTIIVSSNKTIRLDSKSEICKIKSCKKVLIRNSDVIDGSYELISENAPKTKNIKIIGGIWSEESVCRGEYGVDGIFDESDSLHGVYTCMLFSGVDNLTLKNLTLKNAACFGIQIGRARNVKVKNINFQQCFADGVHINGDINNATIENVSGENGDDLIAVNAYDWANSTINNGKICNVKIDGVHALDNGEHKLFRIQPGIVKGKNGDIDCSIKNLCVKNVTNVSVFKMYLQTPSYKDKPDGTEVGSLENIVFDNITVNQNGPGDRQENYLSGDAVTGHFGVFEIGSNVTNLVLKNIDAQINYDDFKTAHFITVGPKSCFKKEFGVELFDPYVECVVNNINYKNIKINGNAIYDLRQEIKEVSFGKLYETDNTFGFGKVKDVVKLN